MRQNQQYGASKAVFQHPDPEALFSHYSGIVKRCHKEGHLDKIAFMAKEVGDLNWAVSEALADVCVQLPKPSFITDIVERHHLDDALSWCVAHRSELKQIGSSAEVLVLRLHIDALLADLTNNNRSGMQWRHVAFIPSTCQCQHADAWLLKPCEQLPQPISRPPSSCLP